MAGIYEMNAINVAALLANDGLALPGFAQAKTTRAAPASLQVGGSEVRLESPEDLDAVGALQERTSPQEIQEEIQQEDTKQEDVQDTSRLLSRLSSRVSFLYNRDLSLFVAQILDSQSGEILKEIPSEELVKLRLALMNLAQMQGMLVDETV